MCILTKYYVNTRQATRTCTPINKHFNKALSTGTRRLNIHIHTHSRTPQCVRAVKLKVIFEILNSSIHTYTHHTNHLHDCLAFWCQLLHINLYIYKCKYIHVYTYTIALSILIRQRCSHLDEVQTGPKRREWEREGERGKLQCQCDRERILFVEKREWEKAQWPRLFCIHGARMHINRNTTCLHPSVVLCICILYYYSRITTIVFEMLTTACTTHMHAHHAHPSNNSISSTSLIWRKAGGYTSETNRCWARTSILCMDTCVCLCLCVWMDRASTSWLSVALLHSTILSVAWTNCHLKTC